MILDQCVASVLASCGVSHSSLPFVTGQKNVSTSDMAGFYALHANAIPFRSKTRDELRTFLDLPTLGRPCHGEQ